MSCIYCEAGTTSLQYEIKPDRELTDSLLIKNSLKIHIDRFIGSIDDEYILCPACGTKWVVEVNPIYIGSDSLPWAYCVKIGLYSINKD